LFFSHQAGLQALIDAIYNLDELKSMNGVNVLQNLQDGKVDDITLNYLAEWYSQRVILTPLNEDVDVINELCLSQLAGESHQYFSADEVGDRVDGYGDPFVLPPEYLHSLVITGIPLHRTELKIGCPIILLRNLQPSIGLCNGTRLIVTATRPHVIRATIITGQHHGVEVFLPRISLDSPNTLSLPFTLRRHQFPVHLGFSMTINKAQGQSIPRVGINLLNPVFSHGQLYVALSRSTQYQHIRILLPIRPPHSALSNGEAPSSSNTRSPNLSDARTVNIVYSEVINHC
jgi:ATP-dependent DNA helicase PIF1